MAANKEISTFKVPDDGKVIDSDWKDDIDTEFAIYGGNEKQEGEYINPDKAVTKETQRKIDRIKAKKIGVNIMNILTEKVA